jgi:hypothetical protein
MSQFGVSWGALLFGRADFHRSPKGGANAEVVAAALAVDKT